MQAILPPSPLARMTHRQRETPFLMVALFPSMGLQARSFTTEALSTTLTLIWPHRRRRATVPPILALLKVLAPRLLATVPRQLPLAPYRRRLHTSGLSRRNGLLICSAFLRRGRQTGTLRLSNFSRHGAGLLRASLRARLARLMALRFLGSLQGPLRCTTALLLVEASSLASLPAPSFPCGQGASYRGARAEALEVRDRMGRQSAPSSSESSLVVTRLGRMTSSPLRVAGAQCA